MISSQFLNIFTTFLLVFSGIALLVATFSIHNTFAIVVAQRTRENALLRALGASRRQVTASSLVEASVVAVTASAVGLAGGIGIAAACRRCSPPSGSPSPGRLGDRRSVHAAAARGRRRGLPGLRTAARHTRRTHRAARRAARDGRRRVRGLTGRAIVGAALAVLAVGTTLTGVLVSPSLWLAGLGAVLALAAFVVLGPVASSAAVRALGAPSTRCAVSPAAWPGATRCAARSGPPPPRAP